MSIDDLMTPVSPVESKQSHPFFHTDLHVPEGEKIRETLHSSISQKHAHANADANTNTNDRSSKRGPYSPTFNRPPSPKSRNASRNRGGTDSPEMHKSERALASHDLAEYEGPMLELDPEKLRSDLVIESEFVAGVKRSADMMMQLDKMDDVDRRGEGLPRSAGVVAELGALAEGMLGPRGVRTFPRPKSTLW